MAVIKVKDYKIVNGKKVKKDKKTLDRETCKGKKWWYFYVRYENALGEKIPYRSKQFATKKEAEEEERIFLSNVSNNSSSKLTLDELFDEYEKYLSGKKNKDTSNYSDFLNYKNHIKPILGNINISDITLQSIREFQHILDCKTYIKSKIVHHYKHEFKTKIHSLLSCILDYAVSMGYIQENVAKRYGNFKTKNDEVIIEEEKIKYQTPEEFENFISVISDLEWKAFFSFLYWNGCRKGEQQAVTWEDINFDTNMIRINKTLVTKIKGGGWKITNTKNRRNRTIALLPQLRPILVDLYNKESNYINFDKKWFVFGGNKFIPSTTIDNKKTEYYDLVEKKYKHNILRLTSHQFGRHSHASLLISLGVRIENIAKRLGDTEEVIRKTYAHLFPSYNDEILEATTEENIKMLSNRMKKYKKY